MSRYATGGLLFLCLLLLLLLLLMVLLLLLLSLLVLMLEVLLDMVLVLMDHGIMTAVLRRHRTVHRSQLASMHRDESMVAMA